MLAGDLPDNWMLISTYALDLKIPLTVSTVGSCNIEVSDGTIIYSDPATAETVENRSAVISRNTDIIWSIMRYYDEPSERFQLKITKHGKEQIFSLSYDSEKLNWVLTVEK